MTVGEPDLVRRYQLALIACHECAITGAGEALDRLDLAESQRLTAPDALLQAALYYAEHGLSVFPIRPNSKIPLPGSRGFKDATTDPVVIRKWWTANPQANIGTPTGTLWDVVDVDAPTGWWSLARRPEMLERLDAASLGRVLTPSGGAHFLVKLSNQGNSAALIPGVDFRGTGGYVVAPPSIIDGILYRWADVPELLK